MYTLISTITYLLVNSNHGAFAKASPNTLNLFNEYEVPEYDKRNRYERRHPQILGAHGAVHGALAKNSPNNLDLYVESEVSEYDERKMIKGRLLRRLGAAISKPKPRPSHVAPKKPVKSNSSSSSKGKTTTKVVKEGSSGSSSLRGGDARSPPRRSKGGAVNTGKRSSGSSSYLRGSEVKSSRRSSSSSKETVKKSSDGNEWKINIREEIPSPARNFSSESGHIPSSEKYQEFIPKRKPKREPKNDAKNDAKAERKAERARRRIAKEERAAKRIAKEDRKLLKLEKAKAEMKLLKRIRQERENFEEREFRNSQEYHRVESEIERNVREWEEEQNQKFKLDEHEQYWFDQEQIAQARDEARLPQQIKDMNRSDYEFDQHQMAKAEALRTKDAPDFRDRLLSNMDEIKYKSMHQFLESNPEWDGFLLDHYIKHNQQKWPHDPYKLDVMIPEKGFYEKLSPRKHRVAAT